MEALASSIEWYLYNLQSSMPRSQPQAAQAEQSVGFLPTQSYSRLLLVIMGVLIGLLLGLLYAERTLRSLARTIP
jgi:cell division protein FtsX